MAIRNNSIETYG